MAADPATRHLQRLLGLGTPAPDTRAWRAAAREGRDQLADGLAWEALASDDVTSAAAAHAFVAERLTEWADLLDPDTREQIRARAARLIEERAPDAP